MYYYLPQQPRIGINVYDSDSERILHLSEETFKELIGQGCKFAWCPPDTKIIENSPDYPDVELWPSDQRSEYRKTHIISSDMEDGYGRKVYRVARYYATSNMYPDYFKERTEVPVSKWIDTHDKYPKEGKDVLVLTQKGKVGIGRVAGTVSGTRLWTAYRGNGKPLKNDRVAFWRKLPKVRTIYR